MYLNRELWKDRPFWLVGRCELKYYSAICYLRVKLSRDDFLPSFLASRHFPCSTHPFCAGGSNPSCLGAGKETTGWKGWTEGHPSQLWVARGSQGEGPWCAWAYASSQHPYEEMVISYGRNLMLKMGWFHTAVRGPRPVSLSPSPAQSPHCIMQSPLQADKGLCLT